MSGKLFDRYGAIVDEDVAVLERCLEQIDKDLLFRGRATNARICEIGMHDGNTALGIKRFFNESGAAIEYWGIDVDKTRRDFSWGPECHRIHGDSAEVFDQVPGDLDLVWVDGCHCMNHVILETIHYAPKVRVGGFICFHDTNPLGGAAQHQYHGPLTPEFGLAVNMGLRAARFPWPGWTLFDEQTPLDRNDCGTAAFRRLS